MSRTLKGTSWSQKAKTGSGSGARHTRTDGRHGSDVEEGRVHYRAVSQMSVCALSCHRPLSESQRREENDKAFTWKTIGIYSELSPERHSMRSTAMRVIVLEIKTVSGLDF